MRVLQLVDEPYDSGLTSSALRLSRLLRDGGNEVVLLCRKGSYADHEAGRLRLPACFLSPHWSLDCLFLKNWAAKNSFDVLHAHTGRMHTLAWYLSRRCDHAVLVRTRSDARRPRRRLFYDRILKRTDALVFPTRRLREDFLISGNDYPMEKTQVIYPAVAGGMGITVGVATGVGREPAMNGSLPMTDPVAAESSQDHLKITMVGRLDPVKGHNDFIQAAALLAPRFRKAQFVMIGAEKNIKGEQLMKLARRLNLSRRLQWFGFLPQESLLRHMQAADIGVIASRSSEAISRVALEWMSLGKPLVATAVGMIPELLAHGQNGYLTHPGCVEEMAYALERLLNNPEEGRAFGIASRQRFLQHYSPEISLSKHLEIYRHFMRTKGDHCAHA